MLNLKNKVELEEEEDRGKGYVDPKKIQKF